MRAGASARACQATTSQPDAAGYLSVKGTARDDLHIGLWPRVPAVRSLARYGAVMGGDRDSLSRLYRDRVLPRLSVADVYGDLRLHGTGRQKRGACPLHGGRGPSFAVDTDTLAWHCHSQCQAGGDPAEFVMRADGLDFRAAVFELARRAGVDGTELSSARERSTSTPRSQPASVRRVVRTKPSDDEHRYPPADEVQSLWQATWRVGAYPLAANYLRSQRKRLDPALIESFDVFSQGDDGASNFGLLRVLAKQVRYDWMKWWWWGGYRLIAPMVDGRGEIRSFAARCVLPDDERPVGADGEPLSKSVGPRGSTRNGLVFACPRARHVLVTGERPPDWPSGEPLRFEVCEGELKYALRACLQHGKPNGPLVFGVVSGSWTDEITARIPSGSRIWIGTDQNPGGAAHATRVARSLLRVRDRRLYVRLRPEFELDPRTRDEPTVRLTAPAQARYDAWKLVQRSTEQARGEP